LLPGGWWNKQLSKQLFGSDVAGGGSFEEHGIPATVRNRGSAARLVMLKSAKSIRLMVLLISVGALLAALGPSRFGGPSTVLVTHGNSMEPAFHSGDLAVMRRTPSYEVGDIVAYHLTPESIVLHRIVGADGSNFIVKGDNNSWVDSMKPSGDDIVGKLWLHIPAVGGLLLQLRSPLGIGALASAIALSQVVGGRNPSAAARRRRAGQLGGTSRWTKPFTAPCLEEALGLALTISVLALMVTIVAFIQPTERTAISGVPYEQGGSFSYSGAATPGSIYSDDVANTGQPIYLQLVRNVTVNFDYRFRSDLPNDINGTYKLVLSVGQDTGWERTVELVPATAFQGDAVSIRGVVPLDQVQSLVDIFSRQTGLKGGYYTVAITPTISTQGSLAGSHYESTYSPALKFRMDNNQLVLDQGPDKSNPVKPVQSGTLPRSQFEPNRFTLFSHSLAVGAVRIVGLVVLIVSAATALVLFRLVARGRTAGEAALIEAQYRSLLVNVRSDPACRVEGSHVIDVLRIDDLVRLAAQTGRMILHERANDEHAYFVMDGTSVYRYRPEVISHGRIWAQSIA
jgi:signal peptidase I